jgi:ribonucleoside-diphosphate reductase alpha chain
MELAEKMGPYETFSGSPASQGKLQFDLWNENPSERYKWLELKEKVQKHGMRNSLLLAPMPTASTSQIMGFNECIEPFTSNLYKRKTMAGEFILVNKYLINDLIEINLWNKAIRDKIMIGDGSIQEIEEIPKEIRNLYKTVWEIKQKVIIDQARDRGVYICQSQSMNLFVEDPDFKKLTSMHFYAWSSGLKTGLYYLRSKPKAKQQKFTIDPSLQKFANVSEKKENDKKDNGGSSSSSGDVVCTDEICMVCSS